MKTFVVSSFLFLGLVASDCRASITGQWDFENGDLAATIGTAMQYRGTASSQTQFGTTASFGIADIKSEVARVMRFPATTPTQGYIMSHGAAPNGGGSKVNQYTLVLDVLFPATSTGFRAFWQTDVDNASDGELFVNGANGIGISGSYQGNLTPDIWHRVVFTVDLTKRELGKYIDGVSVVSTPVGAAPLGSNPVQYLDPTLGVLDQRWSLDSIALLFSDEDGETAAGYVNSVQFHDRVLSPSEIATLGGPNAAGIPTWLGGGIAQWDFNGNLASSVGGAALTPDAAPPAATFGVSFTSATINGQPAQVASFTRGTFFQMTHGLPSNGGGTKVNQYTLIMDVMFPSRPNGWAVLWQTTPGNSDDGDWFINPVGGLGISGVYGGTIPDGTWNRLALVVDSIAGTFTSFLNGTQVQQVAGPSVDGRWSLATTALLFADEDQENAGGSVNSVQLRGYAMNAAEIATLGGAQAAGIPLPSQPSGLRLLTPNGGEVFQAGTTQAVTWVVSDPIGVVQIDLLIGDLLYRSLGQGLMQQSNFSWVIDSKLGDTNNYRVRLASVSYPAVQDLSDAPFSVTGSGEPPNLLFGQALQLNGGFESNLSNWQVIAGNPVVLTGTGGKGAPYAGSRFLHGGLNPTAGDMTVRQDIDLLGKGFTAGDLDSGATLDAEAWLRNAYATWSFDDQVDCRVAFLDSLDRELSSIRSMVAGNNVWVRRTFSGLVSPGTRKLRVEITGKQRRDSDNDSMADEVAVRLQRAASIVDPQITKLPLLQDYRQDAMTLCWETDGNLALHAVDWGQNNISEHTLDQIETVQIDETHFVHRATLTNLAPQTRYSYRVRSGNSTSPVFSFRTAPCHDTPFAVAWWADSQVGPAVLQTLIPSMLAHGVDWMGVSGDLASNGGSLYDWQNYWFKALEFQNIGQTRPALFARGNHDGEHPYSYAYSVLPGNGAWYAFDYGNSRFIFLDTEASTGISPEQYAWLVNELSRRQTQNAAFRVVAFHKPPYVNLWNGGGYTGEAWVRADWVPLFAQYHVDLVINGHAHNYNRGITNGVTYLIVGGGGGALDTERVAFWPLFTVEYSRYHYGLSQISGRTLTWTAYDDSDQLLDNLILPSRVPQLALQADGAGNGQLPLILAGKPGVTYVLEGSAELMNWTEFSTNTVPLAGVPMVTNLVSAENLQRFFRARVQP
jgi:hypothetical protein